jgi:hypothetical protein
MGEFVSKGIGRNVNELIAIQKKLKIINKIAEEQVKRANAKNGEVRKNKKQRKKYFRRIHPLGKIKEVLHTVAIK